VIIEPHNDRTCLGPVTEFMRRMLVERHHELAELAAQFGTTREVARWIRSQPQLDDNGDPSETPKVYACRPPQRLWVFGEAPNCFERSVRYILLAELIDPGPRRKMATGETRYGRHTVPLEEERVVVLDPGVTRNEIEGSLFQLDRGPLFVSRNQAVDWIATLAEEPAAGRGESHRVRNARAAMHAVMSGREITTQAIADIAYTVDEADREATLFGERGLELHRRTAEELTNALITQRRRNAGMEMQLENLLELGAAVLQRELASASSASASSASSSSASSNPSGTSASSANTVSTGSLSSASSSSARASVPARLRPQQTFIGRVGVGNPLLTQLEKLVGKQGIKQGLTLGGVALGGPVGGTIGSLAGDALIATAFRNAGGYRNASWWAVKTPGVILDEINTTDTAIRGLDRDVADAFREPLATPQRAFVDQWKSFVAEWRAFVGDHEHWYDRMWRGSYDKAIEFRERVLGWRQRFEALGGKPTAPPPVMPADDGKKPDSGPWKSILLVAGIGAAALILPEVVRTFRGRPASA
jgi:hypothetical protein